MGFFIYHHFILIIFLQTSLLLYIDSTLVLFIELSEKVGKTAQSPGSSWKAPGISKLVIAGDPVNFNKEEKKNPDCFRLGECCDIYLKTYSSHLQIARSESILELLTRVMTQERRSCNKKCSSSFYLDFFSTAAFFT